MKSVRTALVVGAILVAAGITILMSAVFDREVHAFARARMVDELLRETLLLRPSLESGAWTRLRAIETMAPLSARLTLIDSAGRVIFDTNVDTAHLGALSSVLNHPEIDEALQTGTGHAIRQSAITGSDELLVVRHEAILAVLDSVRVPVAYVALSVPLAEVDARAVGVRGRVILYGVIIIVLIAVAALFVARRLLRPITGIVNAARAIGNGDLSRRVEVSPYEEIGELGRAINAMVQKLESDIRELERLGRYRSEFLGDVSHELRTPIFAIQGSVETVLSDDKMSPDVRRSFLNTAMRNTARLNALVSDLVDISRIESRELRLSLRYFDIVPLVVDIAQEFGPAAQRKGLTMALHAPEHEVSVYGDKDRIRQVIVNLVDNAVKNTERGEVSVRIEEVAGHARIYVADTGIGIPPEHLPRIFERFYRVDKDRSRAGGGTGLGLAIVKHIVEAHGGKIQVESAVNVGSTFWFELPL